MRRCNHLGRASGSATVFQRDPSAGVRIPVDPELAGVLPDRLRARLPGPRSAGSLRRVLVQRGLQYQARLQHPGYLYMIQLTWDRIPGGDLDLKLTGLAAAGYEPVRAVDHHERAGPVSSSARRAGRIYRSTSTTCPSASERSAALASRMLSRALARSQNGSAPSRMQRANSSHWRTAPECTAPSSR